MTCHFLLTDDIDTGDAVGDDFVEIHVPPPDDVDSDRPGK